jgi:hypothetical protein
MRSTLLPCCDYRQTAPHSRSWNHGVDQDVPEQQERRAGQVSPHKEFRAGLGEVAESRSCRVDSRRGSEVVSKGRGYSSTKGRAWGGSMVDMCVRDSSAKARMSRQRRLRLPSKAPCACC